MTVNEMKGYLSEYKRLKHRAEKLINDIESFPQDRGFLKPLLNSVTERVEDITARISAVERGELREVLIRKYINGETLEEIGADLCYSARHVQRMLNRAVGSMEEVGEKKD